MTTAVSSAAEAVVTPGGRLLLETAEKSDAKLAAALADSTAAGLTFLASRQCDTPLSPSLLFFRHFARGYFQALCR